MVDSVKINGNHCTLTRDRDGAGDVVAAHPHGAEEGGFAAGAGLGQLEHRRGLRDGDVVEHAQRADDEPGQQQPGDRYVAEIGGHFVVLVLRQPGQVGQFDCAPGQQRSE